MGRVRASGKAVLVLAGVALAVQLLVVVLPPAGATLGQGDREGGSGPAAAASLPSDRAADAGATRQDPAASADDPPGSPAAAEARQPARLQASGRARALDGLVVDGVAPTVGERERMAGENRDFAANVEYIDQMRYLPAGCELIALTAVLRSMGYDLSETEIADGYLVMGWNEQTAYVGDPYFDGGGLPPCIVDAANAWLVANGAGARAGDLTGSGFDALAALCEGGVPVLVWTTEGLVDPLTDYASGDAPGWYWPEHCVVLCGADDGEVRVADSLSGLVSYDRARFAAVYEACGSMAVAVFPEAQGA